RASRLPIGQDLLAVILYQLPRIAEQPSPGRTLRQRLLANTQPIIECVQRAIGQMFRLNDGVSDFIMDQGDARTGKLGERNWEGGRQPTAVDENRWSRSQP